MKPQFSFCYGDNRLVFSVTDNTAYELENGIFVTVEKKDYPKYDAVEWLLYFENRSDANSAVISDILDCDTLLPLAFSNTPEPGYMPKKGAACVITMNGSVKHRYHKENDVISSREYAFNLEYLDKSANKTKKFSVLTG